MKPLRLELSGFTCFRDKTLVSFEDLNLFAIAGPTGSGKSSILDAIVYALYGQTPRLGSKGLNVLLNPEADSLEVVFEFSVGERLYRVSRVLRQLKSGNAKQEIRVEENLNGNYKQFDDVGLKEMSERLTNIVGLDYDSFVRAVLLPQGAFDEFLRGSNSKRIELLIRLLGLEKVTDMQREAGRRAKEAKAEISFIDEQLQQNYGEASPEAIRLKKEEVAELESRITDLSKTRSRLSEQINAQKELKMLLDDVGKIRTKLAGLNAQQSEIDGKREQLAKAEAAEKVLPLIEQRDTLQTRLKTLETQQVGLESSLAKHKMALSEASDALHIATENAKKLPDLAKRLESLAAIKPRMRQLKSLGGNLGLASDKQTDVSFDEDVWQTLAAREARVPQLRGALAREKEAGDRLAKLEAGLTQNRNDVSKSEAQLKEIMVKGTQAKETVEGLESEIASLESDLQSAKLADEASHLRAHLTKGEACPVCAQVVDTLPEAMASRAAELVQSLSQKRTELKAASAERQRQRDLYSETNNELSAAKATLEAVKTQIDEAKTDLQKQKTEVAELGEQLGSSSPETLERDINVQKRALLADLAASISDATGGEDPISLSEDLRKKRETLEAALSAKRDAETAAKRAFDMAEVKLGEAKKALQERSQDAEDAARKMTMALEKSPFESADSAKAAALSEVRQDALRETLKTFETTKRDAERDEVALNARLGGRALDEAAYAETLREQAEAEANLKDATEAKGRAEQMVVQLEKELEQGRTLRKKRDALEKKAGLYEQLNKDLAKNQFPEFLLTRVQEQLAFRASAILRETSDGRYDLRLVDGDYFVSDAWNTGELRDAKTLSGGETFMASLALALALSETIAGNTVLGALFLDEGFGTLDADTLGSVANVLETLTEEGRMVGLITHVTELTERMPARLVVSKGQAGSTVSWDLHDAA